MAKAKNSLFSKIKVLIDVYRLFNLLQCSQHPSLKNTLHSTRKHFEKVKARRREKEIESKHVHDAYNVLCQETLLFVSNSINEKDSIIKKNLDIHSQWSFSSALMSFTVKLYYHGPNWTIWGEKNSEIKLCANRKAEKGYRFNGCLASA